MSQLEQLPWVEENVVPARHSRRVINPPTGWRINIYLIPRVHSVLESRWPQLILRLLTLVGFLFTLVAAQIGPRVGSRNFAIIMVWIAWWTALKLGFIPLGGRSWCSICPIAQPGEWLQNGGITGNAGTKHGLNIRWPKILKGSWLQSGGFLLIGIFSAVTLTDPHITGWVLLGIFILAIGMSLIFEHRAFCSHICPIGGFSGMYAKVAPVELKVIDKQVCLDHGDKSCYQACPWGLYPLALKDASSCGLCMECLRACPKDNLALNIRPYNTDLDKPPVSSHLDETFLALIMLGSALAFSAVFLGPWGWLKLSAYRIGSFQWLGYALGFLALNLILMPGLFGLCVWLKKLTSRSSLALKRMIASESQGLIPLGLMAWIAFTISFALPKLSYVVGVLNDPLGLGWHMLGAGTISRSLDVSGLIGFLEAGLVLGGVFWAVRITRKVSRASTTFLSSIPIIGFYAMYSAVLLWLLVG